MKMTQTSIQNNSYNRYIDSNNSKINQPVFQTRKRVNSISNYSNITNETNIPNTIFRKSSVYQKKPVVITNCPQNSGYGQLNSIIKDLQLPRSNRASKNTYIEYTTQGKYTSNKQKDKNEGKTYQELKMDLCDLILKKNKSRQKYQDIAKKFGGNEYQSIADSPSIVKKSSNFLQLPKGPFDNSNLNMYKTASMTQRPYTKSPIKEQYSPYMNKSPKSPIIQRAFDDKNNQTFLKNNLRQTLDVTQKNQQLKTFSTRTTLDSFKKENLLSRVSSKVEQSRPKSQKGKLTVSDFWMTKKLGQGKFGEVFRAIHKQTFSLYALKRIKKSAIKTYMMEDQMMMQIKLQLFFNHPNILKLYAMFDDQTYIYLLLQYMEQGTLYSKFKKSGVLTEDQTSKIMFDVLKGVSYLHENDIAHRDIKPQNIVISNGICKLCDFGWSALCKDDRRTTMCGTLDYSAPQVIQGKQYSKTIDLWCLGVMVFELMIGKAPFYHINRKQTMKKIINQNHEQLKFPNTISDKAKDFISKFLKWQPQERLQADKALKQSFITDHNKQ